MSELEKKEGIAEIRRWHNIVKNKQLLKETLKEKKYILLPPDILKKVCVKVESESKYFVR